MSENKELIVKKEGFFSKIINKFKALFKKHDAQEIKSVDNKSVINEDNEEKNENKREEFFNNIKIEGNSDILSLKVKLENGEIKSIDLTDEQIDQLQSIYDKEIEEKKEKIKRLKSVA